MTLFELYLWIAGGIVGVLSTAIAVFSVLRSLARRRLRRMALVLDLSPFIPAGALRHRPSAN